ncbi:hypothetical protein [Paraburkholderia sp. J8-2]|uniref:hypothetical protein n=1 Tax=Paraburkholderia sp. J8-2 TaxID=2805440 RepID=UPI002AB61DAD|nr:hypothetical protein [Paraburkholderia sp. J8-2]
MQIPVPDTGNRSYERLLKAIELEEVVGPAQFTKHVAPRSRFSDPVQAPGRKFERGQLQQRDFQKIRTLFEHPDFIARIISKTQQFEHDEARVFQFHNRTGTSNVVYGTVITDSRLNLIEFCISGPRLEQRRTVLLPLLRALCPAESLIPRLH